MDPIARRLRARAGALAAVAAIPDACPVRDSRAAGRLLAAVVVAAALAIALAQPARAAAPALLEVDLVTANASSVPAANQWGPQGDRLIRTPTGTLYTTYVIDGRDRDHFGWVLAQRLAGSASWQTVASGVTARQPGNPPQVLLGPSGEVFVVVISPWDSPGAGAPELWSSSTGTTTIIPGHWLTGARMRQAGALYPSASVDRKGNLYVWEDVPCPDFTYANGAGASCVSTDRPGTYYWGYRTSNDGHWHPQQWTSDYRQTYNFLLPESANDFRVVGTRDILQSPAEAPYRCPNGTGYCFDRTMVERWDDLDRPPVSVIVARAAQDAAGYQGDLRASAEDAYVDTSGRTHVLVSAVDATTAGTYENHHLVIEPDGQVKDVAYTEVPYPNLSRLVQDQNGRFWLFSVGPDLTDPHRCDVFIAGGAPGDTDGTKLAPATVLGLPGRYNCSAEERNFAVAVRSGTTRAGYIDGVVGTNDGRDWVHYRIGLDGAAASQAARPVSVATDAAVPPAGNQRGGGGLSLLSASPLLHATANAPYSYRFLASGGEPPYRWSIPSGAAGPPAGLSLGADGALTGVPPANPRWHIPGTLTFEVRVTDASGARVTRNFTIVIRTDTGMRIASASPLLHATADQMYHYQFLASGGAGPYRWSVMREGPGPPAGIVLTSAGTLVGVPPSDRSWGIPGQFTLAVEVRDAAGQVAGGSFRLEVRPSPYVASQPG